MATETIEEFLARGGKVQKSKDAISLDKLLYNEGLLDHKDAEKVKKDLNGALSASLDKEFPKKDQ